MRVELCKGKRGYFLRLVGANNKTLAVSESYVTKFNARRAAKKNFVDIALVDKT